MNARTAFFTRERIDGAGAFMALACAVHCVVTPMILPALSVSGLLFLADRRFETAVLCRSLVLAACSLVRGFALHRHYTVPLLADAGVALYARGHFFSDACCNGKFLAAGGFIMAISHVTNLWLCRRCPNCRAQGRSCHG